MKINKYLIGMVMVSAAAVGFTSCNDDDPLVTLDPVTVVEGEQGESTLKVPAEVVKVKIGDDIALPVEGVQGTLSAFSLNEEVLTIVDNGNGPMLQGLKNGTADVMVGDASNSYKKFSVSVYTTDVMQLNKTTLAMEAKLGAYSTNKECEVVLGNGGYSISSNDERVIPTITEDGAISIGAKGAAQAYTAEVTVSDISGLTATITVNVTADLTPFTDEEIQDIMAKTSNDVWTECTESTNNGRPYYFGWYNSTGWTNSDADGQHTVGWWYASSSGTSYGGLQIYYPTGSAVGQEVNGSFKYLYSSSQWYGTYTYDGKAKVLVDNAERTIAIAWQIDLENERINRAYVVCNK